MLSGVPPLTPAGSNLEDMQVCPRRVLPSLRLQEAEQFGLSSTGSAPSMMAATETRPSLAPRTAALSQLDLVL